MRLLLILIFITSLPLFSYDYYSTNSILYPRNSNKNSFLLAKNPADETEYEDESEEEEEVSAGQIGGDRTGTKGTRSSSRPGIPASNADWKKIESEISPEKRKQMTIEGLKTIEALEEKGNASAVRQISRYLLSHPIPEVRARAARSLGKLGRGVRSLHKAIDTDGYQVRQEAYQALEKIGQRQSLKYFINGTKSTDNDIRIASFKGLGKTRSSIGRDILIKQGLTSPNHSIVAASLVGLGYFSRKDDVELFKKYLNSEVTEIQSGAVLALGVSKVSSTTNILLGYYETNPNMEPDIIHALSQKKNLAGTLALIKIMNLSKNENYQGMIQKELYLRRAYGNYAIIKTNTATIRKFHKANAEKVAILKKGDVAKIRKVTEKLYKAKMNREIVEDRYYLIQSINPSETSLKSQIIQGWVFGPKIEVINLIPPSKEKFPAPKKSTYVPDESEYYDEDSEEEVGSPPSKKEILVPPSKKEISSSESEFYDEDEDE